MSGRYVDFREVKARVKMEEVLQHYGLLETLKRKGDALVGSCPIHQGKSKTQFKVSLSKSIWNCFGPCNGGNVLDFVAQMEQVDIREAALLLADWFYVHSSKGPRHRHDDEVPQERRGEEGAQLEAPAPNKPLTFALKNLDPEHTFVARLGFKSETIRHFDAGYCSKGLMRGRVAIPIHNKAGELVAYVGRATRRGEEPYRYPPKFNRDLEVYNLHQAERSEKPMQLGLRVTLDPLHVWRSYEMGLDNTVALLGQTISERQMHLLKESARARARISLAVQGTVPANLLAKLCKEFYVHLEEVRGRSFKADKKESHGTGA